MKQSAYNCVEFKKEMFDFSEKQSLFKCAAKISQLGFVG